MRRSANIFNNQHRHRSLQVHSIEDLQKVPLPAGGRGGENIWQPGDYSPQFKGRMAPAQHRQGCGHEGPPWAAASEEDWRVNRKKKERRVSQLPSGQAGPWETWRGWREGGWSPSRAARSSSTSRGSEPLSSCYLSPGGRSHSRNWDHWGCVAVVEGRREKGVRGSATQTPEEKSFFQTNDKRVKWTFCQKVKVHFHFLFSACKTVLTPVSFCYSLD